MKKNCLLTSLLLFLFITLFSQTWTPGTGKLYTNPSTTKIGIGTTSPSEMLHLNGGAFKIGNGTDATSRSTNLLKFGDGDYIKLGEWESDDKLSFYSRLGFNFSSGFLNVNNGSANGVIGISSGIGNNTPGNPRLILHQRADIPHAYIYFNQNLYFRADGDNGYNPLVLQYNGSVGIGFPVGYSDGIDHTGGYKLAVNGNIHAKSIDVDLTGWPDYVFDDNYKLKTISELEAFIKINKHLPNVPSQQDVKKNGKINLGETQALLLQKIEELTLYVIDIKKENEQLKSIVNELQENSKK